MPLWLTYALLAALCAAGVSIFGKFGMKNVNADMATAARSVVQATFVVVFVIIQGGFQHLAALRDRHVAIAFPIAMVILSGVAGGLSWIFGFRALELADVSQVSPIDKLSVPLAIVLSVLLLKDRPSLWNWLGIVLIVGGAYLCSLPRPVQ
jgi:transporter family protein